MENYGRELRMEADIRKKGKVEKGICRETEKNAGRSRSSIEKDTGGNEKICG